MKQRVLEILPALFSWSAILLPIVFSYNFPMPVAVFILVFSAMWFVRALEFTIFLIYSFIKYKKNEKLDWLQKNKNLEYDKNLNELERKLIQLPNFIPPSEVVHIVIIATYKEDLTVLDYSIGSVAQANYDQKKIILCLATEERDSQQGRKNAQILKKKYQNIFQDFLHFEHPDGIQGEVRGKGSNITHTGRQIAKYLQGKDFSRYLVTTLDADNCVHHKYFSAMTYAFCLEKNRKHRSFQPLSFFFNNIWDVPIINRLVSLSSGFWHMIENGRPDRLRNFASHAQPLEALAEMDFWSTQTIVEDGHQYWRSYLHFKGNYSVKPVFIPIYQDAIQEETFCKSLQAQFLQLRRWAWGATDIPFMMTNWWRMRKELPFWRTLKQFWRLWEGHFMWATAPIIITLTTPVPNLINHSFSKTVFSANASLLIGHFFSVALWGILITMILSFFLIPDPRKKTQKISLLWQWIFIPPVTILFGSLPALTAQTILALGKKLEFNVSRKIRHKTLVSNSPNR